MSLSGLDGLVVVLDHQLIYLSAVNSLLRLLFADASPRLCPVISIYVHV